MSFQRMHTEVLQYVASRGMSIHDISRTWSIDPPISAWAPSHSTAEERNLAASNISVVAALLESEACLQNINTAAQQILRLIHERFADPQFSLAAVSEAIGLSERQIARLLKRYTGQTFTAYVRGLRVEKGKQVLIESDEAIAAVAASVGYGCSRWFSTHFFNSTGISSRQFREQNKRTFQG